MCGLSATHHCPTTDVADGILLILNVLPAQCDHGCKHGECVGPNKCKCFPGYTGKTCNQGEYLKRLVGLTHIQADELSFTFDMPHLSKSHDSARLVFPDLNECGLKPRPCEHRCMNTFGSYKCYCLNGYTVMPDGSCASESHLIFPNTTVDWLCLFANA